VETSRNIFFRIGRLGLVLTAAALCFVTSTIQAAGTEMPPAPDFKQPDPAAWINSEPLTLADLRGQVVLVYLWKIDSVNCAKSFPWLAEVEKKYGPKGLRLIGVHTPETDAEKERGVVNARIQDLMLKDPVMLDNDMHYWNALHNHYWPAFYLIDKDGRLRGSFIGETHEGDKQAAAIETLIATLLAEPAPPAERH